MARKKRLEIVDDPYLQIPPDRFTGEILVRWKTGELKARMQFHNGIQVGQHVCYWPSGAIAQLGYYSPEGKAVGVWLDFDEEGDPTKETHHRGIGDFTEKVIDCLGNIVRIEVFRNDRLVYSRIAGE